jgi:CO/xanthine dehydrogenase FAD-binding subunit
MNKRLLQLRDEWINSHPKCVCRDSYQIADDAWAACAAIHAQIIEEMRGALELVSAEVFSINGAEYRTRSQKRADDVLAKLEKWESNEQQTANKEAGE